MNTEKLAVAGISVTMITAFVLMAFDEYGRRKHELEMAKSGFVRDGNKWVKAEGECK